MGAQTLIEKSCRVEVVREGLLLGGEAIGFGSSFRELHKLSLRHPPLFLRRLVRLILMVWVSELVLALHIFNLALVGLADLLSFSSPLGTDEHRCRSLSACAYAWSCC